MRIVGHTGVEGEDVEGEEPVDCDRRVENPGAPVSPRSSPPKLLDFRRGRPMMVNAAMTMLACRPVVELFDATSSCGRVNASIF